MSADSAPDHMPFPIDDFFAVLERGTAVFSLPRHLENVPPLLHGLDFKTAPKRAAGFKVFDELLNGPFERGALLGVQSTPVAVELLRLRIGRQNVRLIGQGV